MGRELSKIVRVEVGTGYAVSHYRVAWLEDSAEVCASVEDLVRRRGEFVVHLDVVAPISRRPEGSGERDLGIRQDPFPLHRTRGLDVEDGEFDEICN